MTANSFTTTEELKRKLEAVNGDESPHYGPMQKFPKTSSSNEQLSDIFQDQFSLPFDDNEDEDDFDSEMTDILSEDSPIPQQEEQSSDQQQQKEKEQQPAPPQRKKPGRKPNPASPALRKAQNRAAQRAFRERKERHLRELENTIKTLRENQYDILVKVQREVSQYRSLIEQLEAENYYLKEVAFSFECALNNINGNNDATTKMKNAVSLSVPSRSSSVLPGNGAFSSVNSPFGNMGIMQMRQPNLPSQQSVPTAQQIQNTFLGLLQNPSGVTGRGTNLNIPSPAASNVMMSPNESGNITTTPVSSASSPPTPDSMVPDSMSPSSTFFAEEFAREITMADMKPFVNSNHAAIQISHEQPLFTDGYNASQMISKSNSNVSCTVPSSNSNNNNTTTSGNGTNSSYVAEATSMIDNEADLYSAFIFNDDLSSLDEESKQLLSNFDLNHTDELLAPEQKRRISKEHDQMIRLCKKIGQAYPSTVIPKTKYPLTEEQKYYLTLDHDSRIDLIPCLHLRSRMIQYHGQYDLYELLELLINKAKCHGDPLNPDSWELPEEFFERYEVLVFQHCRIKSDLYKKYGHLPKDFDNFYRKGLHLIS